MDKMITVAKTVSKKVEPDLIRITVTVRGDGNGYASAVQKANAATEKAKTALFIGGSNVTGGGLGVNAVYDNGKVKGYRATRTLSAVFSIESDAADKITAALAALPVDWHISYEYSGKADREELLSRAVVEARQDAETIAAAAGVTLGALVKTEYTDNGIATPVLFRSARQGGTDVSPELITLSESVVCAYEVK